MKKSVEVTISEFTKRCTGFAPQANQGIEVPYTMPGDKVCVSLCGKKKGVTLGKLESILIPSESRISPRCAHFGQCGGCLCQHLPYPLQLKTKEEILTKLFAPLIDTSVERYPILPCTEPWNYRNKMEFSFSSDMSGQHFLGLMIHGSHGKVLDLTECHLSPPWFIDALSVLRAWWSEFNLEAFHPHQNRGWLRNATLREGRHTGDRLVIVTVSHLMTPEKEVLEALISYLRAAIEPSHTNQKLGIILRTQVAKAGEATTFTEEVLYGTPSLREILHIQQEFGKPSREYLFHVSPSAFFQPNTMQAELLYSTALRMATIQGRTLFDLYCGTGTIGLLASARSSQVVAIELCEEAIEDAKRNAKENGLEGKILFFAGSVEEKLKELQDLEKIQNARFEELDAGNPDKGSRCSATKKMTIQDFSSRTFFGGNRWPQPDLIIVDPPRAGLSPSALKALEALKAPQILYISCNPATQASNCVDLYKAGYRITKLQPVDQFPQTPHFENIALLEKEKHAHL